MAASPQGWELQQKESVSRALPRLRAPRVPLLVWVPALLVAGIMAAPLVYLAIRSLGAGPESLRLIATPRVAQLIWQTSALAAVVTGLAVAIGVPLAWLITRTDLPWRRFWTVITVLPLVIPTYVGGFAYVAAFGPRGFVQQMLEGPFGIERLPSIYGFGGAAFALILFTYPYVVLTTQGAFLKMDTSFEDASRSLGRGPWATFFRVTLPLLRPAIVSGALLVALYTLSDFGAVSLLQFDSFTRVIYVQYQGSLNRSSAALLGLVLVALTLVVLAIEGITRGRARYYRVSGGASSTPSVVRLGRYRPLAVLYCGVITLLGVVIPVGVLLVWIGRGLSAGTALSFNWTTVWNSTLASGLAALAAVIAALPVAILAVRHPGRMSTLVERITYAAFALPGIVVALSLVFFGANLLPQLYQTLAMLTVGYTVRFAPEAVGALRSGLLQISPRLEEAARSLGRGPHQVLVSVTIPLMWPSVLTGMALVFMSTMKELPMTLLLSPIGFRTLATTIWGAANDGHFAQASLYSLVLLLVSVASLPLILPRAGRERDRQLEQSVDGDEARPPTV